MSAPDSKPFAWEPITPPGVAAFASCSWVRLLCVQFVFALAAASAVVWFMKTDWFPTITAAVNQLPAQGVIVSGRLSWAGESPQLLAEGNFLAFTVDLDHEGQLRPPAHVQFEFGREHLRIFSILGYMEIPYPPDRALAFNRTDLIPMWGAWQPPILWLTFGATAFGLMLVWLALATIYFLPAWLVGLYANRDLNFRGSWKLAGAALMPGAALQTIAILIYGLGGLDLVQLGAAFAAHLLVGWIYICIAPLFAPKLPAIGSPGNNPFTKP